MQGSSWADRLELVGDDDRLVGFAGALPLRLLAERTGLRAGLSAAMTRRGFHPVYDRGQLLVDLAVTQILGGEAISDFQGLRHLAPVIGPVPVDPDGVAGPGGGRPAAAGPDEHGGDRVPAALVGTAGRPPRRVPLAAGGRPGADRDHGGGPGRLDRVRRLGQGERRSPPTRAGSGSARTWPPATTPTTCWRSTPARVTRPPTAPRTTSPCWTWRSSRLPGPLPAPDAGPPGRGRVLPRPARTHRRRRRGHRAGTGSSRSGWSCTDTGDGRDRAAARRGVDAGDRPERRPRRRHASWPT